MASMHLNQRAVAGCNFIVYACGLVPVYYTRILQIIYSLRGQTSNRKISSLQWRHNDHDGVSNHQPHGCILNRLLRAQIKENIKAPRHWPLCGEVTGTGEFPTQRASNVENVSIWWRHHVKSQSRGTGCYNKRVVLTFDRHLGSAAAKGPVKF